MNAVNSMRGRIVARTAVLAGLMTGAVPGHGAGFALSEQGAAGLGDAYAGAAALGEDASTVFYNPAGMSRLSRGELIVGGAAIGLKAEFSGTATRPAALGGGTNTGGTGGDAGGWSGVPGLYLVKPINDRIVFGLGVSTPFGMRTEYDDGWVGRFQGIKSDLKTINVNPAVSYRINDSLSVGVGVNYQRIEAELTNAVVLQTGISTFAEGRTRLKADDDSWGWNAGALWEISDSSRIGVSYRSGIHHTVTGDVTTTLGSTYIAAGSGGSRADIELPAIASVSFVQAVSPTVDLLADVTYTHWSSVQQLTVVNTANGTARDILNFDFDNAWRYSVGVNYRLSEAWMLRAGLAYDQTPVKDAQHRTVRLPDADRKWVAFGVRWNITGSAALDAGYAHLFLNDVNINFSRGQLTPGTTSVSAPTVSTVTGSYSGSVDIFALQYVQRF
ncbi:MAG: hypothetical protein GC151_16825 [Betaproteobacteria bacterium]|nr:hypothetical protein [Betaproteobacteria bacterium]